MRCFSFWCQDMAASSPNPQGVSLKQKYSIYKVFFFFFLNQFSDKNSYYLMMSYREAV